jgi:hypothetical protein
MTVGSREDYRVGTMFVDAPGTLDVDVDNSTLGLIDNVNKQFTGMGIQLSPYDSILGAITAAVDHEVIRLLPGRYRVRSAITIARPVTIQGIGNVRIVSDEQAFNVTSTRVNINGISFEQIGTTETNTVTLGGTFGSVNDCTFIGTQTNAISVTGDNCAVRNCRFVPDTDQSSVSADIYWGDSADNGIALGNMWSTERGYVISYTATSDFTQAANAIAAAIQAR